MIYDMPALILCLRTWGEFSIYYWLEGALLGQKCGN